MQSFKESLFIARTTSNEAIKRDGRGKYYLFFLMNILFSTSILLTPFQVSKWEIVNEIRKGNKISITSGYNSIYGKGYGSLLQANVIKRIIFYSLIFVILLFALILFLLGYGVYYLSNITEYFTVFLWLIPAGILLIMVLIIYPYINVSNSYIFNKYPTMPPSKVLKLSFYSLKNNGKKRLLLINLLELGIKIGFILPFILIALITSLVSKEAYISIGIFSIMGSIALVVSFLFYPRISLIALIMRAELFDEIVVVRNSNKFNATFDFDIDYDGNNQSTLKKIFDIEEVDDNKTPSYQKHLDDLTKNDKPNTSEKIEDEGIESKEAESDIKVDEEIESKETESDNLDENTELKEDLSDSNSLSDNNIEKNIETKKNKSEEELSTKEETNKEETALETKEERIEDKED